MEALKLKIYNVLTGKINVSEFENWLYTSDEFLSKVDSNSFYFDLISINYKNDEWLNKVYHLIESNYGHDLLALALSETLFSKIIASENITICYDLISKLVPLLSKDLVYDTEYVAVFDFQSLYSRFDLIKMGYMKESEFLSEAKYLANLLFNKITDSESIEEKTNVLKANLEENFF